MWDLEPPTGTEPMHWKARRSTTGRQETPQQNLFTWKYLLSIIPLISSCLKQFAHVIPSNFSFPFPVNIYLPSYLSNPPYPWVLSPTISGFKPLFPFSIPSCTMLENKRKHQWDSNPSVRKWWYSKRPSFSPYTTSDILDNFKSSDNFPVPPDDKTESNIII